MSNKTKEKNKQLKKVKRNMVNKPIKQVNEGRDKSLLIAIIVLSILLVLVIFKKYVMPHVKIENKKDNNTLITEKLDINDEKIKELYSYVNVNGTGYDYFIKNKNIDALNFDNNMKLIFALNLISENDIINFKITKDTYQKAMEKLIGINPYYSSSESFDICLFKNIDNQNYNCYNVSFDGNDYNLQKIETNLKTCEDGYAKMILSAVKDNNQIIIKSGYAYVTNICDTKINVYDSESKTNLLGTIDNNNSNNNYYDIDLTSLKDKLKVISYVFQLDSDSNYHFYRSYLE